MTPPSRSIVAALTCAVLALLVCSPARAEATAEIKLRVKFGPAVGEHVPVSVPIEIPAAMKNVPPEKISVTMQCQTPGAAAVPGQIVVDGRPAELWWIIPQSKAAHAGTWLARLSAEPYKGKDVFTFEDAPGKHMDLLFEGRPVNRYMYERDTSTRQRAHETYKVYHHVYDEEGKKFITKGAGGRYTHHRGIFIGFSRTSCGKTRCDTWHMANCTQEHQKFLSRTAGPVLASSTALIHWLDAQGKLLIAEERRTLVFRQPKPAIMLMEFRSRLKAAGGDVVLGGDPEHAGMQYRPHNDVGSNRGELATVYEFHADGIKTTGQRLNENKDLPWAAMCYALLGKRYAVQHINHADNPKGTRYSAYRAYGRFGAFFRKKLAADEVLSLRYRIYATERKMPPREEMNLRHAAFATPPAVTVLK